MAIDNLNFYSNWLPAGQLTDKYSSQPWCLKSKNLDIFSSSKSTKATAWSTPTQWDADVIKQDWYLVLKTDWKVYRRVLWVDTLLVDPSVNFPVNKVSYTWEDWPYNDAEWGTVQDMVVKYEWNEWKSFVVYTDRASFTYSKTKFVWNKKVTRSSGLHYNEWPRWNGYWNFNKTSNSSAEEIELAVEWSPFSEIPIRIYADEYESSDTNIRIRNIEYRDYKYYYDGQLDSMAIYPTISSRTVQVTGDITQQWWLQLTIPVIPTYKDRTRIIITFDFIRKEWVTSWYAWSGRLYFDANSPTEYPTWSMYNSDGTKSDWDCNYYYSYLPVRERKLLSIGDYGYSQTYWMKWQTFQPLYKWIWTWREVLWEKKIVYDFVTDMGWETDPAMDIIWLMIWNEQVYMIWNLDWNWYIIPCDLSWGKGTPYIAYGCEFLWVANIDYLMYLVWEDRGISQLWVYNWQELVAILWGTEEKSSKNLIDNTEQYKFDWKMVEYRDDLILSTSDHRIFAYWQTFWGKGWAFIHELPWAIKELKADWNDLTVKYTVSSTDYVTTLQDDTPIKNYNTEWMAEYPIALWNHLLEKEESDLYCSYILPSANTSLEFWGMANHYHFWTFTSSDSYAFSTAASYKMKGCTWNYVLKYIETNENQYTFRLEWDLPVQTTNDMKITDTEWTELITYSEYNHFRKIGEITTTEYQEWEFRFHNLNNKLELPKSHSLQIMVKGKGTANYTPELFALDLVANQRERW
jgi:hypothetical protein